MSARPRWRPSRWRRRRYRELPLRQLQRGLDYLEVGAAVQWVRNGTARHVALEGFQRLDQRSKLSVNTPCHQLLSSRAGIVFVEEGYLRELLAQRLGGRAANPVPGVSRDQFEGMLDTVVEFLGKVKGANSPTSFLNAMVDLDREAQMKFPGSDLLSRIWRMSHEHMLASSAGALMNGPR